MCRRGNAIRVDFSKHPKMIKTGGEVSTKSLNLIVVKRDADKPRQTPDLLRRERH